MTDRPRKPQAQSAVFVHAGRAGRGDETLSLWVAIDAAPACAGNGEPWGAPDLDPTNAVADGARPPSGPSAVENGSATATEAEPTLFGFERRLGVDECLSTRALVDCSRDPALTREIAPAHLGRLEERLTQDFSRRIDEIAADARYSLDAARAEFRAALAEMDERLALADCRQLAAIAEIKLEMARLGQQQEESARAGRRQVEELRREMERSLAASREALGALEASMAAHVDRVSRAGQQTHGRQQQLIRAMVQMVQPIVDLQRELDRGAEPAGPHPVAPPPAPVLAPPAPVLAPPAPVLAPPAPVVPPASPAPASRPAPVLANCDCPGREPVSVRKGHLPVMGWALSTAGIQDVQYFVDDQLIGTLTYGSLRPDVAADHPQYPDAAHSGFVGRVALDGLSEGDHTLVVRILSGDGNQVELIRSFRLDPNAPPDRLDPTEDYQEWLELNSPSDSDLDRMQIEGLNFPYQPLISLVVPVYNTPEEFLGKMVESVLAQTYGKWELCLANDGSTAPHLRPLLDRLAQVDERIKVTHLPTNLGISGASNAALALATGEFIGLLDHDDALMPFALHEVVRALNEAPETDLLYSDEDKVDEAGELRWDAFFKPDWSPDLLLSMNYVCHFGVYRRSLVEAIGGFRSAYDGSQDYDLVLRFTERTDRIVHIPSVLYSWRVIEGSTAGDMMAKPSALDAARRAVADALERRGIAARVEPGYSLGRWRVRYELRGQPAVTLVIPCGGRMKYLQPCLESVLGQSTYRNLHVLVIDNSDGTAVADHCRAVGARDPRLRYRRHRVEPFNYSALNNYGLSQVDTPYIVLLNDDITVITPDWIETLLEHAQRPEVGVVGPLLLFPDRSIQHAGVILGPYENTGHAFKHLSVDHPVYFDLPRVIRNCSAVTFACAMMRRSVFEEVGGLDETNLAVAFNDVDMCLRIRERGYRVVYTPHAVLFHHESATKDVICNQGEMEYMQRRWQSVIEHDPFYNPNLTREAEDYSLNFDLQAVSSRS